MSTPPRLLNYFDDAGAPICPTCGQAIRSHEAAMRIDDCMIHARCFPQAQQTDSPCEPT